MLSQIHILLTILASTASTTTAAVYQPHQALSLIDFQRLLKTDLDNELAKIRQDHDDAPTQHKVQLPDNISIHNKQRSNVRRRSQEDIDNSELSPVTNEASTAYPINHVWSNLIQHAWDTAESMRRSSNGSFIKSTTLEEETVPCPFLVCTMEIKGQKRHSSSTSNYEDLIATFNKGYEESLLVKSSHNETCGIVTLTPSDARQGLSNYNGQQNIIAMPLVDIMKIHSGTVDEVSSLGWSVPFLNDTNKHSNAAANATERLNQWERLIIVDFTPGLGGMKEESELLSVVNTMMSDIQDMGEVGWLSTLKDEERREYEVDDSVAMVPTLSEMFSLTATLNTDSNSTRVAFWNEALHHGIESEHACSEMFSTLFVKPRSGYFSFDLILNPADGPPPESYESSASNPACVATLVAGLAVHPYVLSVKSNFPIYYGWNIAHKIDSFKL